MSFIYNPHTRNFDYYQDIPETPATQVFFDTEDPNEVGTVFTPDTQEASDTLYVSENVGTPGETWIWNGTSYETTVIVIPASTPFYLNGTTIDAGSNKTAVITRSGEIIVKDSFAGKLTTKSGTRTINMASYAGSTNIVQSIGAAFSVGTTDTYGLSLKTNNVERIGISSAGQIDITQNGQYSRFYGGVGTQARMILDSDNNIGAIFSFRTGNLPRWAFRKDGNETGSQVGGDLAIRRYNDLGVYVDSPISIKRSTGVVTLNGAYTLPATAPTSGQVLGYLGAGTTQWTTPSTGGIWGIANSSGIYTYYATYQLAVASAVAGQTVEMFGSQTESVASHTLKNGVNINYNGYTLTFASGYRLEDGGVAVDCQLLNGEIKKGVSGQFALSISNASSIIRGNALINSSLAGAGGSGSYGVYLLGKIYNLNFKGNDCVYSNGTGEAYGVTVTSTSGFGFDTLNVVNNCTINSTSTYGYAIYRANYVNQCNVRSNGYGSIGKPSGAMIVSNSSFFNLTNRIVDGSTGVEFNNCDFNSRADAVYSGDVKFKNCTLRGIAYMGTYGTPATINSCTIVSETSYCFYNNAGIFQDNLIICLDNSASGYAIREVATGSYFINNRFQLTNSGAVAIHSTATPTVYYSKNSIKGSATMKSAGVVQGQISLEDTVGNIVIN